MNKPVMSERTSNASQRMYRASHLLVAVIAALLIVIGVSALRLLDDLGSPFLFALGILGELLLAIVMIYSLIQAAHKPLAILWSILESAKNGIIQNENVVHFRKRYSKPLMWLGKRFADEPFGLMLTVGLIIAGFAFFSFLGIAKDVWFKEPLTKIDIRVVNLVPSIRTTAQTHFYSFMTLLANWESVILIVVAAIVIFWRRKQYFSASLFALALVVQEVTTFVFKNIVQRPRPEQFLSLIDEGSYSFPSGHALRATVILGLLAYFIFKSFKRPLAKLAVFIGYIVTIFFVALSRVYLGVHYPSDVMASIMLGSVVLVLLITTAEINARYFRFMQKVTVYPRSIALVAVVIAIWAALFSPVLIKIRAISITPAFLTLPAVTEDSISKLPNLYSETLTGKPMEPINFVYVGNESEIEQLFTSHGWYKADPSSIVNTFKALVVGFRDMQYLNGPVTPSYLNAQPQDVAFEKPTDTNKLSHRHHTRIWKTQYVLPDGRNVWVATASFDNGIEIASTVRLPTHHIDPNVDAERTYITNSLQVDPPKLIQVVQPQLGKNASGDSFFTDGKAVIIDAEAR